jgi:hypothetical protein
MPSLYELAQRLAPFILDGMVSCRIEGNSLIVTVKRARRKAAVIGNGDFAQAVINALNVIANELADREESRVARFETRTRVAA